MRAALLTAYGQAPEVGERPVPPGAVRVTAAPIVPLDLLCATGGSHSILGYTNNALTAAQKAEALGAVLERRCTVTYETVGLDAVADAWTRAGAAPDGRLVVVP